MKKERIDVKMHSNRFTYDPEKLGEYVPVAIQARRFCGVKDNVVYIQLPPRAVEELYAFLERVLYRRFDDRMQYSGGVDGEREKV